MKPFQWMMALALLCSTQVAVANCGNVCDPCDSCDMSYSVYADYIYWKLGRSDLVRDEFDLHFCPDYNSGFRVGGAVSCDCWDAGIRYTWFHFNDKKNFLGETVTAGVDGTYHSHYDFDLNRVDIELGYNWRLDCCDVNFRPFAGAILLWVDDKFTAYAPTTQLFDDKVDYKGYGLYLGTEAEWMITNMCDTDVSLVTRGAIGILDGRFKVRFGETEEGDHSHDCIFNPYLEAFAGLKFAMGDICGCYSPELMIGYEVQSYGSWREFDSFDDLASLGLGGLVVRAGLSF